MKKLIVWIGILAFVVSCTTQQKITGQKANSVVIENKDSTQYQLTILDPQFENWYTLHNNPSQYRQLSYYENWNRQYAAAWDAKAANPMRYPFFQSIIGYDPNVEYGMKLNHKLFYYFQYVEHVLNIPILSGGGPHVILN
ncbi:MAG: hypothetical protein JXR71_05285 [Bacteroidales bacterium]|nr:hypothetical protein [Bacteroidales bacterium]